MRPLEHVTILDLSRVLACPFASMILAELGATVIKVEQPRSGDETRPFEPFVERGGSAESAYYFAVNRSKQSITVNLRSPDGQAVIRDLAKGADVLIENFPVGTLARYGLDYPSMRAVNEKPERVVFVLWGASARKKRGLVDTSRHVIIESAHPSPLSAHNGFFGSKPFSRTNEALEKAGLKPIDWRL